MHTSTWLSRLDPRRLFRFLGPVFAYDLVRAARRKRTFVFRVLYCVVLFAILLWVSWSARWSWPTEIDPNRLAEIAHQFFATFMITQFAMLALAAPAYVAGAITEERERQTLPFLLTTDLNDREIVLGKLASRLVHVFTYLLAGLPILAGLQVLGGIEPELLLSGYLATAISVLSLGALSIFFSVALRKTRDSLIATYSVAGGYLLLSGMAVVFVHGASWGGFPSTETWPSPVTLIDLAEWIAAGNVFISLSRLFGGMGSAPLSEIWDLLRNYLFFHAVTALVLSAVAVFRLRRVEGKELIVRKEQHRLWTRTFGRPAVSDDPLVWKELHVESGFRQPLLVRLVMVGLVVLSFIPLLYILGSSLPRWGESVNIWVRGVGTAVGCLLILSSAVRAACSISTERERQTLNCLLTTPIETNDILFGKWLGCVLGLRWGWFWLGSIYFIGMITGGVNPVALPFVLGAWFILAGFFTMLGLWFGVLCQKTLTATVWTVISTVMLGGGHLFILVPCCVMPMAMGGRGTELPIMFVAFGLTPPMTLGLMAFSMEGFEFGHGDDSFIGEAIVCACIGLAGWTIFAFILWGLTCEKFRHQVRPNPFETTHADTLVVHGRRTV